MSTLTQGVPPAQPPRRFVTADEYVRLAGISLTGRSLRNWCARNRYLAEGLGEIRAPGKHLFDSSTAPNFRQIWIEAERKYREEKARLERDADRRLGREEDAQ